VPTKNIAAVIQSTSIFVTHELGLSIYRGQNRMIPSPILPSRYPNTAFSVGRSAQCSDNKHVRGLLQHL